MFFTNFQGKFCTICCTPGVPFIAQPAYNSIAEYVCQAKFSRFFEAFLPFNILSQSIQIYTTYRKIFAAGATTPTTILTL
jgi:hypothetical protein